MIGIVLPKTVQSVPTLNFPWCWRWNMGIQRAHREEQLCAMAERDQRSAKAAINNNNVQEEACFTI